MTLPDTPVVPVRVWAWPVRLAHWALAACVLGCLAMYEGGRWHEWLGYGALAVSALRLCVGGFGLRRDSPARFSRFVLGPAATLRYARSVWAGREPRHLGHNPLGGWMVLALLLVALVAAASGALYVTDRYWGDDTVLRWHAVAGWSLLGLVPLHLAGVVFTSIRHRENLVRSMVDGRKRPAAPGDLPP